MSPNYPSNEVTEVASPNESVTELTGETKAPKLSKVELKRAQAHEERRRRLINKGVKAEDVDQVIAQQDYDSLPPDKKIRRLEKIVSGIFQSFQTQIVEMAQQVSNINHNQNELADVLAINLKAIEKILKKLGLTDEQFTAAMKDAESEINAEIKAALEKKQLEAKEAAEAKEKQSIVDGANTEADEEAPYVPPEATVFGGD